MSQSTPQPTHRPAADTDSAGPHSDTISVLGLEDVDQARTDRLSFRRSDEWRAARTDIPTETLRERIGDFLGHMHQILSDLPQAAGGYELDQVTFSAEVSAKGKVSLLGSGGELGGQAGLTFTFTKRRAEGS